jgi:hypothetical protein
VKIHTIGTITTSEGYDVEGVLLVGTKAEVSALGHVTGVFDGPVEVAPVAKPKPAERVLIREEPVPNTRLHAQWWQEGEQVEVLVQRPPIGAVRDVPFRWLLSEEEAALLAKRGSGEPVDEDAVNEMLRDLIDALLVGAYLRSKSQKETP